MYKKEQPLNVFLIVASQLERNKMIKLLALTIVLLGLSVQASKLILIELPVQLQCN